MNIRKEQYDHEIYGFRKIKLWQLKFQNTNCIRNDQIGKRNVYRMFIILFTFRSRPSISRRKGRPKQVMLCVRGRRRVGDHRDACCSYVTRCWTLDPECRVPSAECREQRTSQEPVSPVSHYTTPACLLATFPLVRRVTTTTMPSVVTSNERAAWITTIPLPYLSHSHPHPV